ncbi:VOC family protein, partial [Catenulispora rubra]|uniref:VOC family protein n=1 Tax=Catenulispora rubra TaxID=280293 RepID=UPI0018920AD1
MITGTHAILYSADPEADRAFLRDVLEFPHVDAGGGWLIFQLPPAELGVHPAEGPPAGELYLMCDDLDATLAVLAARGVHSVG